MTAFFRSDTTPSVAFAYDRACRPKTRTDAAGVSTWAYEKEWCPPCDELARGIVVALFDFYNAEAMVENVQWDWDEYASTSKVPGVKQRAEHKLKKTKGALEEADQKTDRRQNCVRAKALLFP